ncbi:MAG: IS66 family transposase [Solobacterium sp.]|nr:IS66 family transposase [Solobacterium sp.]
MEKDIELTTTPNTYKQKYAVTPLSDEQNELITVTVARLKNILPDDPEMADFIPEAPYDSRDFTYFCMIKTLIDICLNSAEQINHMAEVIRKYRRMLFTSESEATSRIADDEQDTKENTDGTTAEDSGSHTEEAREVPPHVRKLAGSLAREYGALDIINVFEQFNDGDVLPEGLIEVPLDDLNNPMVFHEFVHTRFEVNVEVRQNAYLKDCGDVIFRSAEKINGEYMYKRVSCEPALIPNSNLGTSLASLIITLKYQYGLTYNQIETFLAESGIRVGRGIIAEWVNEVVEKKLVVLISYMLSLLIAGMIIHADETHVQVHREAGKENTSHSYIYVYRTAINMVNQIILYDYRPDRKGENADEVLYDFMGYLISDAGSWYNTVKGVIRCLCLLHSRRLFVDALPDDRKAAARSEAFEFVMIYNRIFKKEKTFRDMTAEERKEAREKEIRPIVNELYEKLEKAKEEHTWEDAFLKAVNYALNNWEGLTEFFRDGMIPLHNMAAEHAMKPIARYRHNSMYFDSPRGARNGSMAMSIIQTAIANKVDPFLYLNYVLSRMTGNHFRTDNEFLESLMPWNEEVKKECGYPEPKEETVNKINEYSKKNAKKNSRAAARRAQREAERQEENDMVSSACEPADEESGLEKSAAAADLDTAADKESTQEQDISAGADESCDHADHENTAQNSSSGTSESPVEPDLSARPESNGQKKANGKPKVRNARWLSEKPLSENDTLSPSALKLLNREKAKSAVNEMIRDNAETEVQAETIPPMKTLPDRTTAPPQS